MLKDIKINDEAVSFFKSLVDKGDGLSSIQLGRIYGQARETQVRDAEISDIFKSLDLSETHVEIVYYFKDTAVIYKKKDKPDGYLYTLYKNKLGTWELKFINGQTINDILLHVFCECDYDDRIISNALSIIELRMRELNSTTEAN